MKGNGEMAKAMTAAELIAQLKKWGVAYKPYRAEWSTHNRAGHGGWGPLNGFMWHHTGSDGDARGFVWNGSEKLPGPLCHFYIEPSGLVWLIGWGRANHAGGGDPAVLAKVVSEEYTGILKPQFHQGESGAVDGNSHFYGVEIGYSGKHGMTASQYSSALKLSAAICDFHNWSQRSVIAHGEWSDWKWDPGYADGKMMDMNAVRNDIADVLNHKDRNADGDTVDIGEPNAPKVITPPTAPVPKTVTLNVGDTVKIGNSVLRVTEVK